MRKYVWRGFTHQQLSMMASLLAGGGSLCCADHAPERATITPSIRKGARILHFAHENLGCRWADSTGETDDSWAERSSRYLKTFLNTV